VQGADGLPAERGSNDGWFKGYASTISTSRSADSRGRVPAERGAIGERRISALIDPNGRVLAPELQGVERGWVQPLDDPRRGEDLPASRWRRYKKSAA